MKNMCRFLFHRNESLSLSYLYNKTNVEYYQEMVLIRAYPSILGRVNGK